MTNERDVILYTRNECSLCVAALRELRALRHELSFTITEVDIDADPALRDLYNDVVPAIAVGERIIAHAPIAPAELRAALTAALP